MVRLGLVALVAAFARTSAHKEFVATDANDPFSATSAAEMFDFVSQFDVLLQKALTPIERDTAPTNFGSAPPQITCCLGSQ